MDDGWTEGFFDPCFTHLPSKKCFLSSQFGTRAFPFYSSLNYYSWNNYIISKTGCRAVSFPMWCCRIHQKLMKWLQLSVWMYSDEVMYGTPGKRASSLEAWCHLNISLQSPAVSTHQRMHRKIQFKCKATEEKIFVFAIYSTSGSAITALWPTRSERRLLNRSHWPLYCLRLAPWYIRFVANKNESPFCSCPSFQVLCPIFSLLLSFSSSPLWLNCAPQGNMSPFLWSIIPFQPIPLICHMALSSYDWKQLNCLRIVWWMI